MKEKVIIPFRWPGGKYYAIKLLRPFWENYRHNEYREPFFGGGSVFFAKEKVEFNWINDLDSELINTLQIMQNEETRKRLVSMFKDEYEATPESYARVKALEPNDNFERAYKYYYLNRTSFSGKMKNPSWGYRPKRSLPPRRWDERILPCGKKLEGARITSLDFSDVMLEDSPNSVLMFLDPPYFTAQQYVHSFEEKDHVRLADVCRQTKHRFFLTYDDCPEIRELYSWAHIYDLKFYYRLDNSRDNEDKRQIGSELVITNFDAHIPE